MSLSIAARGNACTSKGGAMRGATKSKSGAFRCNDVGTRARARASRGTIKVARQQVVTFNSQGSSNNNMHQSSTQCNAAVNAEVQSQAPPLSSSSYASSLSPFHLAIPVFDLEESRAFYSSVLGCSEGRSSKTWVDFNLFGHQLVCHVIPTPKSNENGGATRPGVHLNAVDGDAVPVPHFGVAMTVQNFHELVQRIKDNNEDYENKRGSNDGSDTSSMQEKSFYVSYEIAPHLRFRGLPGEQYTMFFYDPSGNALEFKAMTNPENLFTKYEHIEK